MAIRYFIAAEATYEIMRQSLNAQLGYPNNLGKSIIHTPLQAPRDTYRRVLLAVDTDLAGYAAINAAVTPLISGDSMEELDEATYIAAVNSASNTTSAWDDITGKPTEFTPVAHTHSASDITSGTVATARLGSGAADSSTFLRGDGTWASVIQTSIDGGSATTFDGGVVDGGLATTV